MSRHLISIYSQNNLGFGQMKNAIGNLYLHHQYKLVLTTPNKIGV
jgi:hypothetical protein